MKTYIIVIVIIVVVIVVVIIHCCYEVDAGVNHDEHEAHVADGVEGAAASGSPDLTLGNIFSQHRHGV